MQARCPLEHDAPMERLGRRQNGLLHSPRVDACLVGEGTLASVPSGLYEADGALIAARSSAFGSLRR